MKKSKILGAIAIVAIVAVCLNSILMRVELNKLRAEAENNTQLTRTVQFGWDAMKPDSTATMSFSKQGWLDFFKTCKETAIWYISPVSAKNDSMDVFKLVEFNDVIEIPEEAKEYWTDNYCKSMAYNPWSDGYQLGLDSLTFKQKDAGVSIRLHAGYTDTMEFIIEGSQNPKIINFCSEANEFKEYLVFEYEPTGQLIALKASEELRFYTIT